MYKYWTDTNSSFNSWSYKNYSFTLCEQQYITSNNYPLINGKEFNYLDYASSFISNLYPSSDGGVITSGYFSLPEKLFFMSNFKVEAMMEFSTNDDDNPTYLPRIEYSYVYATK
jgi:hypothetical protein